MSFASEYRGSISKRQNRLLNSAAHRDIGPLSTHIKDYDFNTFEKKASISMFKEFVCFFPSFIL
jgi:hypothetical protein